MKILRNFYYYLFSTAALARNIANPLSLLVLALKLRSPVVIMVRGGPRLFVRNLLDLLIVKEVCIDREYEKDVKLEPRSRIVDIGGGIGEFAIDFALRFPHSTIHTYEPNPETFSLLIKNMRLNGVTNVLPHNVAAGKSSETGKLFFGKHPALDSTKRESTNASIQVEVKSLDSILEALPHCDFLKIDCEGAEYEILYGAKPETLKKIRIVALEWHEIEEHTHEQLEMHLRNNGFEVASDRISRHNHIGMLRAVNRSFSGM